MKHGDKAKSAKAKASGKETGAKASKKGSSKVQSSKKSAAKASKSSSKSAGAKAGPGKVDTKTGNGKSRSPSIDAGSFSNPVVGSAFRRAVKKFPNAFRKLTD